VAKKDSRFRGTGGAGRDDIGLMLDREDLSTREAYVIRPPGEQDRNHRWSCPSAEGRRDREREDERWKGEEDVGDPHDHDADHAAEGPRLVPVARDESKATTDQERESGDTEADR